VSSSSAGIVTGSATVSGGAPRTVTETCVFDKKSYKLSSTRNSTPATYTSAAGKELVGHTLLGGNLTVTTHSTAAGFDVVTVS
jgi:hypothetical protein